MTEVPSTAVAVQASPAAHAPAASFSFGDPESVLDRSELSTYF